MAEAMRKLRMRRGLAQSEPKGLRVIAELVAKPGSADDLRNVLVPFARGSRKEPGCLQYVLLEVKGEPGRFMTYEVWSDRPALDAHMTDSRDRSRRTETHAAAR